MKARQGFLNGLTSANNRIQIFSVTDLELKPSKPTYAPKIQKKAQFNYLFFSTTEKIIYFCISDINNFKTPIKYQQTSSLTLSNTNKEVTRNTQSLFGREQKVGIFQEIQTRTKSKPFYLQIYFSEVTVGRPLLQPPHFPFFLF